MVKVTFLNLLRSKYGIDTLTVKAGTVQQILDQICEQYPVITAKDFEESVLFVNQVKVMHLNRFHEIVKDGDELILTHFVGGG